MNNTSDSPLLESAALQERLNEPGLRILDCSVVIKTAEDGSFAFVSGLNEWEKAHIPGSIFVDVKTQLSDPEHAVEQMMPQPEIFVETMRKLGVGDNNHVVLYDRGNHAWATRVWWMLRVCGFDNASVLNGGWNKWLAENREIASAVTATGYPQADKLSLAYRPELMVNKAKVLSSLKDDNIALIHSLPLPVFTGKVSPFIRAGRIPGSKNLYCETLINTDSGCYIDLERIEEKFSNVGASTAKSIITYCGGGVAASSNAFALTLLGYDNVALYDGSLSEWTADDSLPMELD